MRTLHETQWHQIIHRHSVGLDRHDTMNQIDGTYQTTSTINVFDVKSVTNVIAHQRLDSTRLQRMIFHIFFLYIFSWCFPCDAGNFFHCHQIHNKLTINIIDVCFYFHKRGHLVKINCAVAAAPLEENWLLRRLRQWLLLKWPAKIKDLVTALSDQQWLWRISSLLWSSSIKTSYMIIAYI